MYHTTVPRKSSQLRHRQSDIYVSESALRIRALVQEDLQSQDIAQALFFTTGIVDRIRRQVSLGLTIICDSNLVSASIDRTLIERFPVRVECLLDTPEVNLIAEQRRVTRAEVAMEQAQRIAGPKLIVVGSAPTALRSLLQLHSASPLREVAIVAAPTGYAGVIELKERLWESGLPCIVTRGHRGGIADAAAVTNALLRDALAQPF
ncbi:MAG: precorrin-8X methylmutase [Clostridia bacterium]|nr:precorrin-8X methylmutase [Clostridia bacterium]